MFNLPQYFKNMNLFVDGKGYAGKIEEVTLPKLTIKTDEYRGGGMDAPIEIDLGMEKLEASFTVNEYDPTIFMAFGLLPGNLVNITARGALDQGGEIVPVVANMVGGWKELDMGSWKVGEKASSKVSISCRYYKLIVNNIPTVEIDIPNMVRSIGGTDQLAETRAAIAL